MNKKDTSYARLPEWQASVEEKYSGDIKVLDKKTQKWVGHPEAAIIYADAIGGFYIETIRTKGRNVFVLHQNENIKIVKKKN